MGQRHDKLAEVWLRQHGASEERFARLLGIFFSQQASRIAEALLGYRHPDARDRADDLPAAR